MSNCCTNFDCARCLLVPEARKRGLNPSKLFGRYFAEGRSRYMEIKSPKQFYTILFLEWLRGRQ
jgi:hypothetical protein